MSEYAAQRMDRIYRRQRYIYDATRKYFLFGRDALLRHLPVYPGDTVLEVGCGTARNLLLLHQQQPHAQLFGLDASAEMLRSARSKLAARGLGEKIQLHQGLAQELDYRACGLERPFDVVFFSYALSMMRPWQPALDAAWRNLKPNGLLAVVDFSAQSRMPPWFRRGLQKWLARFDVAYDPSLPAQLQQLHLRGEGYLHFDTLAGDYAYLAFLRKG